MRGLALLLVLSAPAAPAADPPTAAQLEASALAGSLDALLELGRRGDRSEAPFIRRFTAKGKDGISRIRAQAALAKLGDEEAFAALVADAGDERGPALQNEAVRLLAYVGGRRAVAALAGLLDRDKPRKEPDEWRWEASSLPGGVFKPLANRVIPALHGLVPDPPTPATDRPTPGQLAAWRRWWAKNKGRYEGGRP